MEYSWSTIFMAIGLTALAGLSTGLGAVVAFFAPRTDRRLLSLAMGLSAGVMIYISFMEMLPQAFSDFTEVYGSETAGKGFGVLAFFLGIGLIALIDKLVPEDENPHEAHTLAELEQSDNHHLKRTGTMLMLAIGIHNFPEGMATLVSCLDETGSIAVPIVIAIALHNIPEGMAVAVPVYHSTGNRRKALKYSLLSGLAEPVGAIVGLLVLLPLWSPAVNAWCLASVAGIMVYISFDELLPGAERYGFHHWGIAGVVTGMAVMALTLIVI